MKIDQIINEGMLDNPGQQDSPVAQAIVRRILLQRTDLLAKYGPEYVGQAVDDVADFVGDVEEIGSSDVSGWVRQVEQNLKTKLNQYDEPMRDIDRLGEQDVAEGSLEEVSLDLAKRARDKAEHMVDMDYDDMRDKPYGHSEKQRIKFQQYIDKKEPRAKGDRDWSPPKQGVDEGNYDRDDYYNARQSREYGKGLTATGYGGDGSGTRRDDIFKGQSKRLPADPFGRTSGAVPKTGTGRIHSTALPGEMDEGEKVGNMDADRFDDAMARLKKLAGAGPMHTVYDPNKRVYKNVPVAVQPAQQPKK